MFNQVILVGNCGADAELRYTNSGVAVASFPVAVNEVWTDQNGEKQEKTVWVKISCWRATAEMASKYITKGKPLMIVGKMENPDVWLGRQNGDPLGRNHVTASSIKFMPSGGDARNTGSGYGQEPATEPAFDDDQDIPF